MDHFSNEAVWMFVNRRTGYRTRINGALAEILMKYPADYRLKHIGFRKWIDEE